METITISAYGISIVGIDTCWRCGRKSPEVRLTIHHGIPQTLKPMRNVEIPICMDCHDEINKQDIMSTLQFIYKLNKNTEELIRLNNDLLSQTRKAASIIENLAVIKIKTKGVKE
jgi:hypothetical protein